MRQFQLLLCVSVSAVIAACSSANAPVVPTSITHNSVVTQSGTVAQTVATPPSVRLVDASDNPTAGVTVNWTVTAGAGSVGSSTSTTDADGVAVVSSWTLGTVSGVNRLRASTTTLTGVEFEANAAAGAAIALSITAGNTQTALVGAVLPIDPSVVLRDQYGNGKPGIPVVFAVAAGGGLLTGAMQTTGSDGVATLGSWRLGAGAGVQTLSATVQGLAPVQLSAVASVSPRCQQVVPYNLFATVSGALDFDDCLLPNTFYHDFFLANVPTAQALRFTMQSTTLNPYVLLLDADGDLLAEDGTTGTTMSLSILAPPGDLVVLASTFLSFQLGSYSLSSTVDDGLATNCEVIFAMRGISVAQNLTASDCVNASPSGPFYSDQFIIFLNAGIPVTIRMSSLEFDTFLELYGASPTPVAANNDISGTNPNSEIIYTPTVSNYYAISASSFVPEDTGAYTLTILPGLSLAANSLEAALRRMGVIRRR